VLGLGAPALPKMASWPPWSYFSGSIHSTSSTNSQGHWRCWQVAAVMVLLAEFINQD
jgi:hypothetical protein